MATAYLEEYERTLFDYRVGMIAGPLVAKSKVTVTGAAADIATFNTKTRFAILRADVNIQYSDTGDADANSRWLPAGEAAKFEVIPGQTLSVILATPANLPLSMTSADGDIFSVMPWQSADGAWWLLVKQADGPFERADAEGYLLLADINDVPDA